MDEIKELQQELGELTTKLRSHLERVDKEAPEVKAAIDKISDRMDEVEKGIKERLDTVETKLNRSPGGGNDEKGGDKEYKAAFNAYLRKGTDGLSSGHAELLTKALATDSDPSGGFAVPSNLSARFLETLVEISPIRGLVTVETISQGDSLEVDGDDSTQWGVGMLSQRGTVTETATGQLRMERIPVHTQYADPKMTNEALKDTRRDLEDWLNRKVAQRMAQHEASLHITGTGVGEAEGILTKSGITEVNSGNASALTATGIMDLFYDLPTFYSNNGTFILHRKTIGELRKLADTQGQFLWQPGLDSGRPSTLLGRPVVEMPDMPQVAANAFPIIFADLRAAYTVVDREGFTILRDPFSVKGSVEFFTTRRWGGQVVLTEAIRKHKVAA